LAVFVADSVRLDNKTGDRVEMKFEIGDKIVHPQHGIGFVAGLEEKQFEPDAPRKYYVISIPDTTVWVPVDLHTSGLRNLCTQTEIEQCRQVLQSEPQPLKPGRNLLSDLGERIKQGTVIAHCEVIRDLTAYGWHKPLYGPTADFQRTILDVLCQEWAAVEGVSVAEATREIGGLLKKGRAAHRR
jgi:CarD family transcriptional regulator